MKPDFMMKKLTSLESECNREPKQKQVQECEETDFEETCS